MPVGLSRPAGRNPGLLTPYLATAPASRPVSGARAAASRHQPECRRLELGSQNRRVQEAAVNGLILLVLIGVVVAYIYTRMRGKMKMSVSGKNWIAPVVIVVVVGLLIWASSTGGH
jgi:cation transporter-like permease